MIFGKRRRRQGGVGDSKTEEGERVASIAEEMANTRRKSDWVADEMK